MDVGPRDAASGDDGVLHRLEISRAYLPNEANRRQGGSGNAFDEDGSLPCAPIHRDDAEPDSRDTRDLLQTRGDLFVGRHHLLPIGDQRRRKGEVERLHLRRTREARLDLSHGDECASHQAGDGQEHDGKRNLSDDERIPRAMAPRGGRARSAGLLQQLCAEHARSQDGNEAEQETGHDGDAKSDEQHRRVDADLVPPR